MAMHRCMVAAIMVSMWLRITSWCLLQGSDGEDRAWTGSGHAGGASGSDSEQGEGLRAGDVGHGAPQALPAQTHAAEKQKRARANGVAEIRAPSKRMRHVANLQGAAPVPEVAHLGMARKGGGGALALENMSVADQEALALRMLTRRAAT